MRSDSWFRGFLFLVVIITQLYQDGRRNSLGSVECVAGILESSGGANIKHPSEFYGDSVLSENDVFGTYKNAQIATNQVLIKNECVANVNV